MPTGRVGGDGGEVGGVAVVVVVVVVAGPGWGVLHAARRRPTATPRPTTFAVLDVRLRIAMGPPVDRSHPMHRRASTSDLGAVGLPAPTGP
jgi:hypothetical protein